MVLAFGEILADMIGIEKDGVVFYERKAGGAPFNVACGVKQFGGKAGFVGNVGDDIIGKYLIDFAHRRNLDECIVTADPAHNTTLAFVELDSNGERSFCFYRKDTADFHMPEPEESLLDSATIICVGSLMLSEESGFSYAKKLVSRARNKNKIIAFDVNFRSDIFRNQQTAIARYKEIIQHADIVKFSEDEVEIFGEDYIRQLDDKLLCISLGSAGSRWIYQGQSADVATISVKPVDTTGAGDAFYAGVLTKLSQQERSDWNAEFLTNTFRFGNICGALNTLGKGAINNLPQLSDIEAQL